MSSKYSVLNDLEEQQENQTEENQSILNVENTDNHGNVLGGHNESDDDDDLHSIHSDTFLDSPIHSNKADKQSSLMKTVESFRVDSVSASSATNQPTRAETERKVIVGQGKDGVFSNISAKPELPSQQSIGTDTATGHSEPSPELPTYESVQADSVPSYNQSSTVFINGESIDTADLVDERHVGSVFDFIFSVFVSFGLQFVGFVLCLMFCQSHAGRLGARAGLGLALVHLGLNFTRNPSSYSENADTSKINSSHAVVGYCLFVLGWFLAFQATGDYFRVRRMRQLLNMQSSPSGSAAV